MSNRTRRVVGGTQCPNPTPVTARLALRLNTEPFYRLTTEIGLSTDAARARAFGVDRSTVNQLAKQRRRPSALFIGRVLGVLGADKFAELFTVIDEAA